METVKKRKKKKLVRDQKCFGLCARNCDIPIVWSLVSRKLLIGLFHWLADDNLANIIPVGAI